MLCLCFISPFTKKEAPANSHLHTPLSSSAEWARALPHSYVEIYYTQKNQGDGKCAGLSPHCEEWGGKGTGWCTEIFVIKEEKAQLLIGDWSREVYRFFQKDDRGVKHLTIGLKKTPAAWNLYESAKYESLQCGCQTRLSCVAKRAPWTGTRGGGGERLGWLYFAVRHRRHDLMLLFLHCSMGGLRLILYCHLLAPWAGDLCSCSFISTVSHWWIVGTLPKFCCTSYFGAKVNHPRELKGREKNTV